MDESRIAPVSIGWLNHVRDSLTCALDCGVRSTSRVKSAGGAQDETDRSLLEAAPEGRQAVVQLF